MSKAVDRDDIAALESRFSTSLSGARNTSTFLTLEQGRSIALKNKRGIREIGNAERNGDVHEGRGP